MQHTSHLGYHEKTKNMNHSQRRTKVIDKLWNKIITENFSNLRMRGSSRCRKLTEYQIVSTKKVTPPDKL
jgi:hypothetical protein